jgi:hypothetical protein
VPLSPEVYFGIQPYGTEASAFAKRELDGEEVGLELDVQKIDPYGRLLAYVYLPDGRMFNEILLEEGYAQVATFLPNVKYKDRFLQVQREAREANRGLWGLSPTTSTVMATAWRARTYRERLEWEVARLRSPSLTLTAASAARLDSRIGGGGSLKWAIALLDAHTSRKIRS